MASTPTNTRERVGVAEGPEPAASNEDTGKEAQSLAQSADPDANIYQRLWRIERELGRVEKSQTATVRMESGGQYTYQYSGHDLIMAAVNPLLAKHGVKALPTTTNHERIGNMSVVTVRVDFINVDRPEDRASVEMVNYGADKGDKGASKALTNAVREAIKKAFNITSLEDQKADETTEFQTADGATRKDVDIAKEQARSALEKWATSFKSALENAQDGAEVMRLQRENKDQLTSEHLPEVTRSFFIKLIEERKKALA